MPDRSVLLVNDNDDDREIYETGLLVHGFRVRSLGGPHTAHAIRTAVNDTGAEVMVLSLGLRDPAAWQLVEELECGGAIRVPGVLLTESIRPDALNRIRSTDSGCAAFVAKPCTPDALAAVLRAVLSGERGLVVTRPAEFTSDPGEPRAGSV